MPVPTHLLDRAYQLIGANQLQNAELVLDAVVRVDPQNVEAWKTYLMIHQDQNDLDWLRERILKTSELSQKDKIKLIKCYQYLTEQLSQPSEHEEQINTLALLLQDGNEDYISTKGMRAGLELIDVFDYPATSINKEIKAKPRPRPRRRKLYNPFTMDFASGILRKILQHPVGRKFAVHLERPIAVVKDYMKNPRDAYARFTRSPHFKMHHGGALLLLFVLSLRIIMVNNLFGYILLGLFVIGSWQWLSKYESHTTHQTRVYLHEHTIGLPEVEEKDKADQGRQSDGESPRKKSAANVKRKFPNSPILL